MSIDASKPLDITHLFEMGSQAFEDFIPWFVEAVNKAYSENDWLKALTQLGGSPHPGYIVKSGMPITLRNNLTRLERDMPLVYQTLTSFSPAAASLVVRAKFDDAIDNQPGEGATSMPIRDAIKDVYGAPGLRAFDAGMQVADIITGVPGHVANQVDHLLKDVAPLVTRIGELVKVLQEIVKVINEIEPDLDEWLKFIIKNIAPGLKEFDKLVAKPYLQAIKDSGKYMDMIREQTKQARTAPDSPVPAIPGPSNIKPEELIGIRNALTLPFIGNLNRSELYAMALSYYGGKHQRGFEDQMKMLLTADSMPSPLIGVGGLAGGAVDAVTRPPVWFMTN